MSYACYRNLGTNKTGGSMSSGKGALYKTNASIGVTPENNNNNNNNSNYNSNINSMNSNVLSNDISQDTFPYQIKNINEKHQIINNNSLVVVYVYGTTCRPCQSISPHYKDLAIKYNKPNICVLVKENADLRLSPEVTGVPFFQIYKNGKRVESLLGSFDEVESLITKYL